MRLVRDVSVRVRKSDLSPATAKSKQMHGVVRTPRKAQAQGSCAVALADLEPCRTDPTFLLQTAQLDLWRPAGMKTERCRSSTPGERVVTLIFLDRGFFEAPAAAGSYPIK